jgi:sulfate transport system ATP-binding protein
MSITLERVTKRYSGQPVVNEVSLEIANGEFFVLLGPSGSGKSTLLRAIAGLADIDGGAIALHGNDVTHVGARERGVGFVFQNYALFRHLSVAENIEFALRVRRMKTAERRARRQELLKLVALEGFEDRLPAQLSGGQQQRVAVARALAHRPPVLLLDEPFGALDAKIREELRRTIRSVQRELGITTVLVTHDQEEAFALADRIGVMNLGRLLEAGDPHTLYARPTTRFVATFLGAANLLLARQTSEGVHIGEAPVDATGQQQRSSAAGGTRDHELVAVLRPEEVELAVTHQGLTASYIGAAIVEDVQFTGALERVRLKLLEPLAAIQHGSGDAATGRIEATRTQAECRALPLQAGDAVSLGARRLHVLPTPLSSFVLHAPDSESQRQLQDDPVLATLAARMKTRVAAHRTDTDAPQGVAVTSASDPLQAIALLRSGANEALLLTGRAELPRHLCIHWTDAGVRSATMAVAASLLRHLPAEAICVAASTSMRRDAQRQAGLRALIDAHAEARAAHALETRTELLAGELPQALNSYLATLELPMLVLGTADLERAGALLGSILQHNPQVPALLVYREHAA